MKKCKKCGKELHESEFDKEPHNKDGLKSICKDCKKFYNQMYLEPNFSKIWSSFRGRENYEKELNLEIMKPLSGYKIYILNHTKKGEFKYNIISTNGERINTNDKNEFVDYIVKNI